MNTPFLPTLEFARSLDREDELGSIRERFIIPPHEGSEQVYLLGNSLGLQPKSAKGHMDKILQQWSSWGVEAFFRGDDPWLDYHDHLLDTLAEIIGAKPAEITVMNQLTVNLHLMLVSFYRPKGKKMKILCEQKAFPSDQYMLETHMRYLGLDPGEVIIEIGPDPGEPVIPMDKILSVMEERQDEIALLFWGGVNYYTGQLFDMAALTAAAHKHGIIAGYDLAHAAGNVELHLHDWDVDFACWCSYKYLNSGPGAVAGAFIHERYHNDPSLNRLAGWWGYEKSTRFRMEKGFMPITSAEGWQLSTPSLLLYACHRAALEIFGEAGWPRILLKQKKLGAYLWFLLDDLNTAQPEQVIQMLTPRQEKGCQVSLFMHRHGKAVYETLTRQGIIVDWREPDVIRLAPVPLYNRYEDVWRFYAGMRTALRELF